MSRVIIIGCGAIGATIAYELSQISGLKITVVDQQGPAQGSTGAALGVLMGVISQKVKGRNWQLRETSLRRYETLIPELEEITGRKLLFNQQGILLLCLAGEKLDNWYKLAETRRLQGWQLELWDNETIQNLCPNLRLTGIEAGVYSPQDRQIDPTALTLALVEAAKKKGVDFQFKVAVEDLKFSESSQTFSQPGFLQTTAGLLAYDWLIIAAGLGSSPLLRGLNPSIEVRPVLGQALHLRLQQPVDNCEFQPVVTCDDVHVVPIGNQDYWVGATVEFPAASGELIAESSRLDEVLNKAIAFYPSLAEATRLKTWSGLRPRPEGQPAPIIQKLPGHEHILVATGHYRNGILLAPATAAEIRAIVAG